MFLNERTCLKAVPESSLVDHLRRSRRDTCGVHKELEDSGFDKIDHSFARYCAEKWKKWGNEPLLAQKARFDFEERNDSLFLVLLQKQLTIGPQVDTGCFGWGAWHAVGTTKWRRHVSSFDIVSRRPENTAISKARKKRKEEKGKGENKLTASHHMIPPFLAEKLKNRRQKCKMSLWKQQREWGSFWNKNHCKMIFPCFQSKLYPMKSRPRKILPQEEESLVLTKLSA